MSTGGRDIQLLAGKEVIKEEEEEKFIKTEDI
jgi:hypothetical protein